MNLVFQTFRDNLLTASQSEILHNSKLIKVSTRLMSPLPPWVNEHKGLVIVVSSAYKMNLRLALTLWISFIYIIRSRGPNIEPWGTPVSITRLRTQCHQIQHIGGVALDNSSTNPEACLWYHNIWVLLKECHYLRYQKLLIDLKRLRKELFFGLFRVGFYR